mgnify:CR=1 FL=1
MKSFIQPQADRPHDFDCMAGSPAHPGAPCSCGADEPVSGEVTA